MVRSLPNAYTLAEGDRLPTALNTPQVWGRLLEATAHIHDAFRPVDHGRRLQVVNVVGFIDLGQQRVQILPKVSGTENSQGEPAAFLLDVLTMAGVFPRTKLTPGRVVAG